MPGRPQTLHKRHMPQSSSAHPSPYYIHAPQGLDEGSTFTAQLHMLCHQLNRAGYPAYLASAPTVYGMWWTPILTPQTMAAHHMAGLTPISIQLQAGGDPMLPGLQVRFEPALQNDGSADACARLHFSMPGALATTTERYTLKASLPWFDTALLDREPGAVQRTGSLVYSGHLPGPQFKLRPEHEALTDVSPFAQQRMGAKERWRLLAEAEVLFAYAAGSIVTEARILGCQVVYVANDHQLQNLPQHPLETWGTSLNTPQTPLDSRDYSPQALRETLCALMQDAPTLLHRLIETTQAAAAVLPPQLVWSAHQLHRLEDLLPSTPEGRAARADAQATDQLCKSYEAWKVKAAPTEIYSDICAELVNSGKVRPPTVHLFSHGRDQSTLADTMDELGKSWLPPRRIVIHADVAAPFTPEELGSDVQWMGPGEAGPSTMPNYDGDEWIILLDAGTRLEPYTLIELLACAHHHNGARMVYAAHDVALSADKHLPHFTGGTNLEWLRGTNYLGGVVAVRCADWMKLPDPARFASAYRLALRSSAIHGAARLHYVDQVLSHSAPQLTTQQEAQEFCVAQEELQQLYPGTELIASSMLGCWTVQYPDPGTALSLIIPTGKQQGYLRALLQSCIRYYPTGVFEEALLLVQDDDLPSMQQFVQSWPHANTLPLRLLPTGGGAYNHARSINLGLRAAHTELVVVCDDDIEWLDAQALPALRRFFTQESVALAAPRLVLQKDRFPLVMAGPHVAGEGALLQNYVGERQGLTERGLHNRLQMAQDVVGVHASCWMARRSALLAAGALDEVGTPIFQSVTDLGYRLQQSGWRLVWAPQANALHAGGMTVNAVRRDPAQALALSQAAMAEAHQLRNRWLSFVGQHPIYSKHLSGSKPYTLDMHLANRWSQDYRTRPRVLAQPISSGSGQYRVIEPLDALQMRSMAETCVVAPPKSGKPDRRVLTPLDVARFKPDRILVQHSISDQDIANLRAIRETHPQAFIVQLMDDLTSDLPASHPNHVFGQREGHTRTLQALELSDRLIVSTQPLADYYAPYCRDIRLVPNALDPQYWGHLQRTPQPRERLRVGWAGAAQHLGDLRLVERVVQTLADEVDWVFMGMCPDELRPYIKEFHGFVSYKDYPAKLASLDLDIAIAPLENNLFNACKSNLRLLEYGAMGWPVVCSDVYPYQTMDPPVLRVPDDEGAWLAALRRLIKDPGFRRAQGQALHDWQQQHYLLGNHVDAWFHAIFE